MGVENNLKRTYKQCHIDTNGDFFEEEINHPYNIFSKTKFQKKINKLLNGSGFKLKKEKLSSMFYITRNGRRFINIEFVPSTSGGKTFYRTFTLPFCKKSFLRQLKNTDTELLLISPYSMFSIKDDKKYSFSNDVFLIANKTDIFKSQLGEDVKALEKENIENANFSCGSRWMSLKNIKKSMEENKIVQNRNKNLSCVPASKFLKYIEDVYSSFCARDTESKTTKNSHFGFEKGIQNERLYYSGIKTNPVIREIAKTQYCENGADIVDIHHTGGNNTLSIYGKSITQKADLIIKDSFCNEIRASLKLTRNAYLSAHKPLRWLESMEIINDMNIPNEIKETFLLFYGTPDTPYFNNIIQQYATQPNEIKYNRLYEQHLREYNNEAAERLLAWFTEHQVEIFKFSAVTGNMADERDYVTHIAFVDAFNFNNSKKYMNIVIPVDDLLEELTNTPQRCTFNKAGTQIWTPWGSLENHRGNVHTKIKLKTIEKSIGHEYQNDIYNGISQHSIL